MNEPEREGPAAPECSGRTDQQESIIDYLTVPSHPPSAMPSRSESAAVAWTEGDGNV